MFFFPLSYYFLLASVALNHERRRSFRMNQVDFLRRQVVDAGLIGAERFTKLILVPALDLQKQRDHADPLGQKADEFFQRSGSHRGFDQPDDPSPACIRHNSSLSMQVLRSSEINRLCFENLSTNGGT